MTLELVKNLLKRNNVWLLLSISFVLYKAVTGSITGDELSTLQIISNLNYKEILNHSYDYDFNPPLYYLLTKISFNLIPTNLGFRLITVIAFVFVQTAILRLIIPENKTLSTGWVLLNPLMIYLGCFGRSYMLAIAICLMVYYYTLKVFQSKKNNPLIVLYLGIIITIGFLTNYLVGAFTALLYIILISINRFSNSSIINTIKIFVLCLPVILIEIPYILSYTEILGGIKQTQATNGPIIQLIYMVYGIIFGETLAPVNLFVILLSGIIAVMVFYSLIKIRNRLSKETSLILAICAVAIPITSFTNFGRPMYLFYIVPLLPIPFIELTTKGNRRFSIVLTIIFILIYLFSNLNFLTNNSKYYFSPVATIQYDELFKNWNSKNSLTIITPSYNKSNFYRLNSKDTKNIWFVNNYDIDSTDDYLNNLTQKMSLFDTIHFIHEKPDTIITAIHERIITEFDIISHQCDEHKSLTTKSDYCYFTVNSYSRR